MCRTEEADKNESLFTGSMSGTKMTEQEDGKSTHRDPKQIGYQIIDIETTVWEQQLDAFCDKREEHDIQPSTSQAVMEKRLQQGHGRQVGSGVVEVVDTDTQHKAVHADPQAADR